MRETRSFCSSAFASFNIVFSIMGQDARFSFPGEHCSCLSVSVHLYGGSKIGAFKDQVHLTGHAGIEALNCPHEIYSVKTGRIRPVGLDNRRIKQCSLAWAQLSPRRSRAAIDARWHADLIIADLCAGENRPMRQETTPSPPEAHTEPLSGCWNLKGTRHVLLAA